MLIKWLNSDFENAKKLNHPSGENLLSLHLDDVLRYWFGRNLNYYLNELFSVIDCVRLRWMNSCKYNLVASILSWFTVLSMSLTY